MKNSGLLVLLLLALSLSAQGSRQPGLKQLGEKPLVAGVTRGVLHPAKPVHVLQPDGFPALSEAGLLQLADEGEGFYYGALNQDRIDYARSIGMLHTNNWGDVEALCMARRIVAQWVKKHPETRLGIDEISGCMGGFPDYDGDGVSDHLTHQTGHNVNFLVPCRKRPERYVHLGVAHEDLFDHAEFLDLMDTLVEAGVSQLTTNNLAFSPSGDWSKSGSRFEWLLGNRREDGYSLTLTAKGRRTGLCLLNPKGDHGDHINAMLWRVER